MELLTCHFQYVAKVAAFSGGMAGTLGPFSEKYELLELRLPTGLHCQKTAAVESSLWLRVVPAHEPHNKEMRPLLHLLMELS